MATKLPQRRLFRWGCTAVLVVPIALSVAIGVIIAGSPDGIDYRPLPPAAGPLLSDDEVAFYHKHGFVLKKGLLKDNMLELTQEASEEVLNKFFWTDWISYKFYGRLKMNTWRSSAKIAKVAFESQMPSIAAQLLGNPQSLRLLKDAFFQMEPGKKGCDFHVDDAGFWPTDDESNGVTFWIALTNTSAEEGGGLRIVPDTHNAEWTKECRQAIKKNTCEMASLHPECYDKLYNQSLVFDMEPGDALIWQRFTFHRGEPFHTDDGFPKVRYSIRYVPDTARAGRVVHVSQERGERFGAAYPQVWPKALASEVEQFQSLQLNWKTKLLPLL